ncbi:hypothetical protein [uncultured Roseobacter sp.]|uniref:hypothetical protein n=1 Tax=uncultured Roseobacter sp. TaxID=114847 RepID=UPI0026240F39|nr:hypothetical protein [uncultured Roseobacter sp.]
MPKFLLIYHGKPDIQSSEDGARHMAAWKAWSAGMGVAVTDPGLPVGPSKTITANGVEDHGGPNPASGMTVLEADTMKDAIALAKDCPHLSGTGTIEIAEAMDLDM